MNCEAFDLLNDLAIRLTRLRRQLIILELQLALSAIVPNFTPWRWRLQVHPVVN